MKRVFYIAFAFLMILGTACNKIKKTAAEEEREAWISGFNDSIAYYQTLSENINSTLLHINEETLLKMQNFEKIDNPREVTGYYILKGWSHKIPLKSTGVYARINENEKPELIATLAGSHFNQISVETDGEEFYSEIVPHDQAFNFRHDNFNTVYFYGGKVDTIMQFVAQHNKDKIFINFIEGGKKRKVELPAEEKNVITETWQLFDLQNRTHLLQKELWINSRKIETFRRLLNDNQKLESQE